MKKCIQYILKRVHSFYIYDMSRKTVPFIYYSVGDFFLYELVLKDVLTILKPLVLVIESESNLKKVIVVSGS